MLLYHTNNKELFNRKHYRVVNCDILGLLLSQKKLCIADQRINNSYREPTIDERTKH